MKYNIHPTAFVDHRATILDPTSISVDAHAVIGPEVTIERGVYIGPGSVIGNSGCGYTYDEEAGWTFKPHEYGVILAEGVHIRGNVCVDRGSWRDTYIGSGTVIDNLVHIAHNVVTGDDCMIIAGAEVSGSCNLASQVYIGPNACVRERLNVGRRTIVGMGAVVVKDVPDGMIVAGVPARVFGPVDEWPPPPPKGRE